MAHMSSYCKAILRLWQLNLFLKSYFPIYHLWVKEWQQERVKLTLSLGAKTSPAQVPIMPFSKQRTVIIVQCIVIGLNWTIFIIYTSSYSHYAEAVKKFGPPVAYWTARFESKHRVAKEIIQNWFEKKKFFFFFKDLRF